MVLFDIIMPGMDGYQISEAPGASEKTKRIAEIMGGKTWVEPV